MEIEVKISLDFHVATIIYQASVERLQHVFAAAVCEGFEEDVVNPLGRRHINKLELGSPGEVNATSVLASAVFSESPVKFYENLSRRLEKLADYAQRNIAAVT